MSRGHFHVIPRPGDHGLGIEWIPGKLAAGEAEELRRRIAAALDG